jgi:Glycosyltransferase family 87
MSVGASAEAGSASLGWWRTASTGALVAAATISIISLLAIAGTDELGWDFRYGYLRAAELVLDGASPYPELDDVALGDALYLYPPQLAVVLAPVSLFPADLVVWIAFVGAIAALVGALALLGVRDLRCYAAVLAWGSTSNALEMTNITVYLVPALAAAWRFRATIWPLATILGLAISTKLFLWPIAIWALATGRYRAAVRAIGLGVVVTFSAWAVIGFEGLTQYPELLRRFSEVEGEQNSYSIVAAAISLGFGAVVGQAFALAVGGALVAACVYFGRRAFDDERAFIAAIGAALAFTPVAWLHYYVLLAVPLAIARPRFSAVWLLPIVLWVCPRDGNGDGLQPFIPLLVAACMLGVVMTRTHGPAKTTMVHP